MANGTVLTQESRSERVTLAVSPTEKRAVRGLASFEGLDESALLRIKTIAQIMEEFERRGGVLSTPAELAS